MNEPKQADSSNERYWTSRCMALGLLIGSGFGVILSAAIDRPAFIAIGVGAGMCLGLAIGAARDRQEQEARGAGSE